MKKIILTSLLGLFGFFGAFVSAGSVDWFTSDNDICVIPFDNISSFDLEENYDSILACSDMPEDISVDYATYYVCISSSDFPYIFGIEPPTYEYDYYNVSSSNYCVPIKNTLWAGYYEFKEVSWWPDESVDKNISWKLYFSATPITYWDNSWWDNSWGSLLPWWESDLSWIITWLNSTINEFIPYLVYLGLWIITVIIWFVAIRWLVNRTQAKIRWTFSSWRRRR